MGTGIKCQYCGYESVLYGQYCCNCGKPLISVCRVCMEDNEINAKFCRKCGAELASALKGLSLSSAYSWREQFRHIFWQGWDELDPEAWNAIRYLQLPVDPDAQHEPWIFATKADGKPMKPKRISVNKRILAGGNAPGFIVATRCRLGVVNTKEKIAQAWWFADLTGYTCYEGELQLRSSGGDLIKLELQAPSHGWGTTIAAITEKDVVNKSRAVREIEAKAAERRSYAELFNEFAYDIVGRVSW